MPNSFSTDSFDFKLSPFGGGAPKYTFGFKPTTQLLMEDHQIDSNTNPVIPCLVMYCNNGIFWIIDYTIFLQVQRPLRNNSYKGISDTQLTKSHHLSLTMHLAFLKSFSWFWNILHLEKWFEITLINSSSSVPTNEMLLSLLTHLMQ